MKASIRRTLAILLWTMGAFFGWFLCVNLAVYFLLYWQQNHNIAPLVAGIPQWAFWVMLCFMGGVAPLILTVGAFILGRRGRLPGTSKQDRKRSAFPIEPISTRK